MEGRMQKWEYCEVEVTYRGPVEGTILSGWIYRIDKKHIEFGGEFGAVLADLGLQGWEMVTSNARVNLGFGGNYHKINYLFKRPLEEQVKE
jgi:hypothetical protein